MGRNRTFELEMTRADVKAIDQLNEGSLSLWRFSYA